MPILLDSQFRLYFYFFILFLSFLSLKKIIFRGIFNLIYYFLNSRIFLTVWTSLKLKFFQLKFKFLLNSNSFFQTSSTFEVQEKRFLKLKGKKFELYFQVKHTVKFNITVDKNLNTVRLLFFIYCYSYFSWSTWRLKLTKFMVEWNCNSRRPSNVGFACFDKHTWWRTWVE